MFRDTAIRVSVKRAYFLRRTDALRWSSFALAWRAVAPDCVMETWAPPEPYCVFIRKEKCAAETLPFDSINSLVVMSAWPWVCWLFQLAAAVNYVCDSQCRKES